MSDNAPATQNGGDGSLVERVVMAGDLSKLTPRDRTLYYRAVCDSVGLNPLTRPFNYLQLSGKLVLYANKDCADQLRQLRGVSIHKVEREQIGGLFVVTAYARDKEGREDSDMGAVSTENLKGDALANAMLKAITKAKRRVTLSICGLGMLDETEVETIPEAAKVDAAEVEAIEPRQKPTDHITAEQWKALEAAAKRQLGTDAKAWLAARLLEANCKRAGEMTVADLQKAMTALAELAAADQSLADSFDESQRQPGDEG